MALRDYHGRSDLDRAARHRLKDARALLAAGPEHSGGALYLAGYAVECRLKVVAMEVFNCWTLESLARRLRIDERLVYTHGLESLLRRLPSYHRFAITDVYRSHFTTRVNRWRSSWRYSPRNPGMDEAVAFVDSAEAVYTWLENNMG